MFSLFKGWEIQEVPGVMRIAVHGGGHREIPFSVYTRKRRLKSDRLIRMVAFRAQELAESFNGDVLEIRLRWGGIMDGFTRVAIRSTSPLKCLITHVNGTNTYFRDIAAMGSNRLIWKC